MDPFSRRRSGVEKLAGTSFRPYVVGAMPILQENDRS
jgi:hypothetical protein